MKIEINKNPSGRCGNFVFGFVVILDGVVRVFSIGFLHTDFMSSYAKRQAKKRIK